MNKGFTLIELIGIVLILATIVLISFPMLTGITKKENDNKYNSMVEDLCLAGKSYIYANISDYDLNTADSSFTIDIKTLIDYGNVSSDIINPKTNNSINSDHLYFKVLTDKTLDCEYRNTILPDEYQEIEYIESNGTQYMDDVYIIPLNSSSFIIETESEIKSTFEKCLVGSPDKTLEFGYGSSNNSQFFWISASIKYVSTESNLNRKNYFKGFIDKNGRSFITDLDGGSFVESTYTISKIAGAKLNLLTYRTTESGTKYGFSGKVYNIKFTTDDIITRNFIPCYRKIDGEVGMYDLVEGKFYENQGSGDFIAGPVK